MKKIVFKRLEGNTHPLPSYATAGSAAFDLCACLTRTCKLATPSGLMPFNVVGPLRKWSDNTTSDSDGFVTSVKSDCAPELVIKPRETILIPTGYKTAFQNAVLQLHIRSSLGIKNITLANNTGIIDSDYRGELFIAVHNESNVSYHIHDGDRIAQGILMPIEQVIIEEGTVDITDRGEGGFGSTNK